MAKEMQQKTDEMTKSLMEAAERRAAEANKSMSEQTKVEEVDISMVVEAMKALTASDNQKPPSY